MPNPITNFKDSFGTDLGDKLITKEYLMTVYPQISGQIITPELWVWGTGSVGNTTSTNILTPVTTFAGGSNWAYIGSSAAIKTDGTLWLWGSNIFSRLGNNDAFTRCTPVTTFAGGTNWKQVAGSNRLTAAIKTDGTLWVWGNNNASGALGINDTTSSNVTKPTPVTTFAGGTNWKQVSCGYDIMAAIKTDGTLWTWGAGALGNGGGSNICTPVTTFAGGNNWKQVSVANNHMAAVKTDGTLWIWGGNSDGQLGNNRAPVGSVTPITTFAGGTNWKQVSCGYNFTAAVKTDGTLWTWGKNGYGAWGSNTSQASGRNRCTPGTTFAGGTNWKQVGCFFDTCVVAIKTDGTLWTWGDGRGGRLGNTQNAGGALTPITTFAGGTNWKQISSTSYYFGMGAIKTSDDLQGI